MKVNELRDAVGKPDPVLHIATGVIGKPVKWYEIGEYRIGGDSDGRACEQPVVALDNGNAFLVRDDAFVLLTARAALFVDSCRQLCEETLKSMGRVAQLAKVDRTDALMLMRYALSACVAHVDKQIKPSEATDGEG